MGDDKVEVADGPRPTVKWVTCGDTLVAVIEGKWLSFGGEGPDTYVPIAQIDNIRRCLDRIEQLAD